MIIGDGLESKNKRVMTGYTTARKKKKVIKAVRGDSFLFVFWDICLFLSFLLFLLEIVNW